VFVVVACDPIDADDMAGATAMNQGPLAARLDPDGDRLHAATAGRAAVARPIVEVSTPETVGTMVSISGAGRVRGHGHATATTEEVARGAVAAPAVFVGSHGFVTPRTGSTRIPAKSGRSRASPMTRPGPGFSRIQKRARPIRESVSELSGEGAAGWAEARAGRRSLARILLYEAGSRADLKRANKGHAWASAIRGMRILSAGSRSVKQEIALRPIPSRQEALRTA